MIDKSVFDFLSELSKNNNREWFEANRVKYLKAKENVEYFVNSLIPSVREIDASIGNLETKDCLFRIFKDVRFSKDKTPYKTNMGAFIAFGGRKSINAGYYMHIEPGKCFLGGGVYMPSAPNLKAIRSEIFFKIEEFLRIINHNDFIKYFGKISDMGDSLKKAPKDFPSDWEHIELLKFKSYVSGHNFEDSLAQHQGFDKYVLDVFRAMLPLNAFLNMALDGAKD